jgi:hypothetical protein
MTERYSSTGIAAGLLKIPDVSVGAGYRVRTGDIQLGKTKTAVLGRDGQ